MGDAAHFVFGIGHHVPALTAAVRQGADALFAEIDIAVKLAHDQQVDLASHFGAQGGKAFQPLEHGGGAQVGEQAQFAAQAKDRLFRAQMPFKVIAG